MQEPTVQEDQAPPHLTLIGTGHVLDIASKLRDAIHVLRPDVVFVELDRGRLHALELRRAGKQPPTPGGWLQKRLHAFQEGVAAEYGVRAGDEMLAAAHAGYQVGAQVHLADRPIGVTLDRVKSQVTLKEKLRLFGMVVGGSIKSLWSRESARDVVDKELTAYNTDPQAILSKLRDDFPTIHRVIIAERDQWMADRIQATLTDGMRGIAVVGDGHVDGMLEHLDGMATDTYRLPDVQDGKLPAPVPGDTTSVSIGFDLDGRVA